VGTYLQKNAWKGGLVALLGLVPVGLFFLVAGGGEASEEERVAEAIGNVAVALEESQLGAAMEPISDSYSDHHGLSKKGLRGFLFQQFRKRGPIDLTLSQMNVEVEGEEATARFETLVLEGRKGATIPLPLDGDLLHFEVVLRREEGDWRIISHRRTKAPNQKDSG
jgi:hypothetical protein